MSFRSTFFLVAGLTLLSACSSDDPVATGATGSTGPTGSGGSTASAAVGTGGAGVIDGQGTVENYRYQFDLLSGAARSEVRLKADEEGNCFALRSELPASNVEVGGVEATEVEVSNGELRACGPFVAAGETTVIGVDELVPEKTFLGLDIGFSRKTSLAGGTFSYLLSWVGGCEHFGPCDTHPGRLSSFDFEITHPEGTVALCPGVLTAGATTTSCTLSEALAPTYSAFAIAADTSWVRKPFTKAAGVDLVFYEAPGGKLADTLDANAVGSFMDWITGLLGPYPYGNEMRIAGAPTAWLGFEHPANIILKQNLPDLNTSYGDTTMHVLMHEIIHQWAGDHTTLANTADFVWKEATCEYLAYVFEDTQGPAGHADATRAYWHKIASGADYYPRPTDEPTPAVEEFYGDTYGPGPMVLYLQLEPLIGRDKVLQAISSFLGEPGVRSVADLQSALETASGQDLSAYFKAWVFGSGAPTWPSFTASTTQQGDQVTVTVEQTGPKLFGCVVEVDVTSANETVTALIDFGHSPTSASAQATVTLNGAVTGTQIDPRDRVIEKSSGATSGPPPKVWIF